MASVPPLEIKIDQDAIRAQVSEGIAEALRGASWKLRQAADALDPEFVKYQDEWIEQEIQRRVETELRRLKKVEND